MDLHISDLLNVYKPRPIQIKNRGQWIKDFYREVVGGWNANKSIPLTYKELSIRMMNVPDAEMPVLWKLCKESESFSRFFWWRIKLYPRRKKEKKPKNLTLKL